MKKTARTAILLLTIIVLQIMMQSNSVMAVYNEGQNINQETEEVVIEYKQNNISIFQKLFGFMQNIFEINNNSAVSVLAENNTNEDLGELIGIEIIGKPNKTTYYKGENFEPDGITVRAKYKKGSVITFKNVTDYTVLCGENLQPGTTQVIIGYRGHWMIINGLTVLEKDYTIRLREIKIIKQPTKKTYYEGDYIDTTGMIVQAIIQVGNEYVTRNLSASQYVVNNGLPLNAGETEVMVSYCLEGVTKIDKIYGLTVYKRPATIVELKILKVPNKTTYYEGENFDPAGMQIGELYSNKTIKILDSSRWFIDGGKSLTKGTNGVRVIANCNDGIQRSIWVVFSNWGITVKERSSITNATITLGENTYIYNGKEQKPTVTVKLGEAVLKNGIDYEVAYSNNKNAGMGTVIITGKGNYTGRTLKYFTINKRTLNVKADAQIIKYGENIPLLTYVYDNNVLGEIPLFLGSLTTNAISTYITGEYDILIGTLSLRDNGTFRASNYNIEYTGAKLTITGKDISNSTIVLSDDIYVYDGTEKKPSVTVKYGNNILAMGIDYEVEYSNNKNAGIAKVIVTGKGNYTGNASKGFTINKRTLNVKAEAKSMTYGENIPTLTYTYENNVTGEVPAFSGNLTTNATSTSNVGEYDILQGTLTLSDNGIFKAYNYDMTYVGAKITIETKEITENMITIENITYVYDGTEKRPSVTVKYGNKILAKGTDYEVKYNNNVNVGTAMVTITGKGNYSGSKTINFTITQNLAITIKGYEEVIKDGQKYINNIQPNTTVEEIKSHIDTNGTIKIYKNNEEITEKTVKISTGMRIEILLNNEKYEYVIVVKGDVDGDGETNFTDMLRINKHRLNVSNLSNEFLLAGDVNADNKVDFVDILQINKFRLGVKSIL